MPLQFIFFTSSSNVILTIGGCWLLQNLENRNKSNKFKRLQIKVFFFPNIIPLDKGPSNLSFFCIYPEGVLKGLYSICFFSKK